MKIFSPAKKCEAVRGSRRRFQPGGDGYGSPAPGDIFIKLSGAGISLPLFHGRQDGEGPSFETEKGVRHSDVFFSMLKVGMELTNGCRATAAKVVSGRGRH